jgi:hypothetical protein
MNRAADSVRKFAHAFWRELNWRRTFAVTLISLVLATQILFQPGIFQDYEIADTLRAFVEYFVEAFLIGLATLAAVTSVNAIFAGEGFLRAAALAAAVALGVAMGVAAGLAFRYGEGPYPNALYIAGETIRWMVLAGMVTLIDEIRRRERAAIDALHRLEVDRIAIEKQRVEARLQVMQAQIEPHFLFNTLATVKRLYRTDHTSGTRMLDSLMQYLRAALPRLREDEATLGDEVDLIGAYLDILRIRMGERLRYSMEVPPEARKVSFPSMMLITLVENAIKHGIAPSMDGGVIDVRVELDARRLQVDVADTGVGFKASSGSGIGLANIRARLAAIFGAGAELALFANEPRGVVARIVAPLRWAA